MSNAQDLENVRRTYEQLGQDDPLWAVLTVDRYRHNQWDENAFFETGVEEIEAVMDYLAEIDVQLHTGRALDFGCGVGRLSLALAGHFDEVVGVDIAESMVDKAAAFDAKRRGEGAEGGRCRFIANTSGDLSRFDSGYFDFVYSNITLQHIPPVHSKAYVADFIRILKPGGTALFMIPGGAPPAGSLRAAGQKLIGEHLRPLWKRIRGRPTVGMHRIARADVVDVVEKAGGDCIDIRDVRGKGRSRERLRYCVRKKS